MPFRFTGSPDAFRVTAVVEKGAEGFVTYKGKDHYVILPQFEVRGKLAEVYRQYKSVSEGFIYRSDLNDEWVKPGDLDKLIKTIRDLMSNSSHNQAIRLFLI